MPTAARFRPTDHPMPEVPEHLRFIISQAITHGIAVGLQQRNPTVTLTQALQVVPRHPLVQAETSEHHRTRPLSPSLVSEGSIWG